jgi:hypothetical protein
MRGIRRHLTYANVMVTILAFLVLGGGTALASYVVSSNSQIGPARSRATTRRRAITQT